MCLQKGKCREARHHILLMHMSSHVKFGKCGTLEKEKGVRKTSQQKCFENHGWLKIFIYFCSLFGPTAGSEISLLHLMWTLHTPQLSVCLLPLPRAHPVLLRFVVRARRSHLWR